MERGLRQGDPLSPLLFLLIADALQNVIRKACSLRIFKGVFIQKEEVNVSLLQYADDALVFGKWEKSNIRMLISILELFHKVSGLKVNIDKSMLLGVNVSEGEISSMARSFHCKHGALPFIYLGLPVGAKPKRAKTWNPVIEKIAKRLACWKANAMSFGGRLTIIRSVLDSLPVYYMSLFKVPKKVVKRIDVLRRRFFWNSTDSNNRLCWVAWKYITAPKSSGGLGIKSIVDFNYSLLSKWVWRFYNDKDALWNKIIRGIYGDEGGFREYRASKRCSTWRQIISCVRECSQKGVDLVSLVGRKVFNGKNTSFWMDSWLNELGPLAHRYPRLFALEANKKCSVFDRWKLEGNDWLPTWCWRCTPRGRSEAEAGCLADDLKFVRLDFGKEDAWFWKLQACGAFSVKSSYDHIRNVLDKDSLDLFFAGKKHTWTSRVPIKVNIFMWRACLRRLPFKSNLVKKGISVSDKSCALCGNFEDADSHVFFECAKTICIWKKVFGWWSLKLWQPLDWSFVHCNWNGTCDDKICLLDFHAVMCVTLWAIWSWRNKVVFESSIDGKDWKQEDVFPLIQNKSFLWLEARNCRVKRTWTSWIINPRLYG